MKKQLLKFGAMTFTFVIVCFSVFTLSACRNKDGSGGDDFDFDLEHYWGNDGYSNGFFWLAGDVHTHSIHSDGTGTMFENFAAARAAGLDYIGIADHNTASGWQDAVIAGRYHNVIPIRGIEHTRTLNTIRGTGHAIFMNATVGDNFFSPDTTIHEQIAAFRAAQSINQSINQSTGLVYIAHPFALWPIRWCPDSFDADVNGIEVWCGIYGPRNIATVRAFRKWDELNNQGRRLYGIAASDKHSPDRGNAPRTFVRTTERNAKGIADGYRRGHMFGTNGPKLGFQVGSNIMGDTISANGTQLVNFEISAEYTENLSKLFVIKNGEVVETIELNSKSFDGNVELEISAGDFVRIEVEGFEGNGKRLDQGLTINNLAFFNSAPFAFTNPIFFD